MEVYCQMDKCFRDWEENDSEFFVLDICMCARLHLKAEGRTNGENVPTL